MARRSKHQLSRYHLVTCDMGQVIPVGLTEVLPMDTVQHAASALIRLSPMQAPVMHPITIRLHHFFVPHRLVWDKWEDFITGGPDGQNADTVPTITRAASTKKDLFDYYGVPPISAGDVKVNAMPIRGYNLIYNEFFRDQDLVTEVTADQTTVLNCAWEKDYFTAARPWEQKGPEVTLPIAGQAPVKGIGVPDTGSRFTQSGSFRESGGATRSYAHATDNTTTSDAMRLEGSAADGYPTIYADLAESTSASINEVRRAFAIQRYQEARARYGSRYAEYLRYLGASPGDHRLQRPEFLAGGKARVAISEVLQTANEPTQQRFGVGDLYGHGVSAVRGNQYRKHFNEHGYIHTLMSVRPRAIYTQGVERHWLYQDKEDFWQKELEFIGQQPVYDGEVYVDGGGNERGTFGYADRYRHYKEGRSCVTGEFRDTLNYWHMGREFESKPTLNQAFTDCSPTKRIFNEQTANSLWCMIQHRMVARRLVAKSAYARII